MSMHMWLINILSVHTHVSLQAALGLQEALCVNLTQRVLICSNGLCFVKAVNTLALKMAWLSPTRLFLAGSKGMFSYWQLMAKGQGSSLSIFPWEEYRALLVSENLLFSGPHFLYLYQNGEP